MFKLRKEYQPHKTGGRYSITKYHYITLDDGTKIKLSNEMDFESFNLLCRNGYSFIFDLTKRNENKKVIDLKK